MVVLQFYIPEAHVEVVKSALFAKGAGRYKNYDCCSWQVCGEGQFRPLKNSNPFIGKQEIVETVNEYKVEMICEDSVLPEVIKELHRVHPYEEPAYFILDGKNKLGER